MILTKDVMQLEKELNAMNSEELSTLLFWAEKAKEYADFREAYERFQKDLAQGEIRECSLIEAKDLFPGPGFPITHVYQIGIRVNSRSEKTDAAR